MMNDVKVDTSMMELSTKQLLSENGKELLGGECGRDKTGVSSHKNGEKCDQIIKGGLSSKESMRKLQHDLEALLSRSALIPVICPSFTHIYPLDLAKQLCFIQRMKPGITGTSPKPQHFPGPLLHGSFHPPKGWHASHLFSLAWSLPLLSLLLDLRPLWVSLPRLSSCWS